MRSVEIICQRLKALLLEASEEYEQGVKVIDCVRKPVKKVGFYRVIAKRVLQFKGPESQERTKLRKLGRIYALRFHRALPFFLLTWGW